MAGRLVVFEGPDGVGKTTVAQELTRELSARGERCKYLSFPGREAGTIGALLYKVHHEPAALGVTSSINPVSLQVLHIAAHIDAIENRILPLISAGVTVVLDRFWWSTWVYGTLAGLPPESRDRMVEVELWHWEAVIPTVVFVIDRDSEAAHYRELRDLYRQLQTHEEAAYPVVALDNTGQLDGTMSVVLEHLGQP